MRLELQRELFGASTIITATLILVLGGFPLLGWMTEQTARQLLPPVVGVYMYSIGWRARDRRGERPQ